MLKIVATILEIPKAGPIWQLVDESSGECIGTVEPESMEVFLEKQKEDASEEVKTKGIKNEEQISPEEGKTNKNRLVESGPEMESLRIPLTEKRFLDIVEFQQYTSLGKNRAADLARTSGCIFKFGRRKMIDRIKFDKWCDAQ